MNYEIDIFEATKRNVFLYLTRTTWARRTDRWDTVTAEAVNMPEEWVDGLHVTEMRGEVSRWSRRAASDTEARYVCYDVDNGWRGRIGSSIVVTR